MNALGAAAVVITLVSVASSGAVRLRETVEAPQLPQAVDPPSMYFMLLDGYPAIETLKEQFDYDAAPFVSALDERGFDVATRSRSNYNRTLLTLASMLHMDYVESIPGLSEARVGFAAQNRQLTGAINSAPVPRMLSQAGYETGSVPSSYGEATLTSVHRVVQTGAMTLFEEQLLRYSAAGNWLIDVWPETIAAEHRRGVLGVLAEVRTLASESPTPQFVLAHVFSPHPPFVFKPDGSPRALLDCYPRSCGMTTTEVDHLGIGTDAYGAAMIGQLEFLNQQLLRTVDHIVARDPEAVIVLFADHGARFEDGPSPEHFRTFFAARTPDRDGLFGSDVSLVNVFPTLFNAYFDTDLAIRDYRSSWASNNAPLEGSEFDSGSAR